MPDQIYLVNRPQITVEQAPDFRPYGVRGVCPASDAARRHNTTRIYRIGGDGEVRERPRQNTRPIIDHHSRRSPGQPLDSGMAVFLLKREIEDIPGAEGP